MKDKAGGAAPRKGLEYQNRATAYFCLTDKPDFLTEETRPTEFRIEQRDSDFSFVIRDDQTNSEHYFESKYRSGKLQWKTFKENILDEFADILIQHADTDNAIRFHLVTNASVDPRVQSFVDDCKKLRNGSLDWPDFDDRHQERNQSMIKLHTSLDDPNDIHRLAFSTILHRHSSAELYDSFKSYVRDCSPRSYTEPTDLILREIDKKDHGIIRREYLEDTAGIRLKKRSNVSSSSYEITDIKSTLDKFANKDENISRGETHELEEMATEAGEFLQDEGGMSDRGLETYVGGIIEDAQKVREGYDVVENKSSSGKKKAERLSQRIADNLPSEDSNE